MKIKIGIIFFFVLFFLSPITYNKALAQSLPVCGLSIEGASGNPLVIDTQSISGGSSPKDTTFTIDVSPVIKKYSNLQFSFPKSQCNPGGHLDTTNNTLKISLPKEGNPNVPILNCNALFTLGSHSVEVKSSDQAVCTTSGYNVVTIPSCKSVQAKPISGIGDINSEWEITVSGISPRMHWDCPPFDSRNPLTCIAWILTIDSVSLKVFPIDGHAERTIDNPHNYLYGINRNYDFTDNIGKLSAGSYDAQVISWGYPDIICHTQFNVGELGSTPPPTPIYTPTPTAIPTLAPGQPTWTPAPAFKTPQLKPICEQLALRYQAECKACVEKKPSGGIWTAIGCLPTELPLLLRDYIFGYGIGIAGGIAFLYFIYGAFLVLTSMGNAEKIEEGKQIIVSALSGLFLIILSIFLLRVVGVDILQLPGFG